MRKMLFVLPGILFLAQTINAQNLVPFYDETEKWGYKNTNSNYVVVDCRFSFAGPLKGGYAEVAANGKWGLIDSTGKIVLEPKYSSIWSVYNGTIVYEEVSSGRRGITSLSGKVTLPPGKLSNIGSFNEGCAVIEQQGKKGMIDYLGNLVVPIKYETIYPFVGGLARVRLDGKWGYVDTKGKVAVPLKYESVEIFSEGLAVVSADGKKGFIDRKGKLISPIQWEFAGDFSEGMAPVKKDGRYGFINKNGELVIPCKYDDLAGFGKGFSNGRAVVKLNDKFGCVDNTGKEIVTPQYDSFLPYSDSLALVSKEGKKEYIDVNGVVKIKAEYDEAHSFYGGMARVKKDRYFGLIRKDGTEVFPCQFSELKDPKEGLWYAEMFKSPLMIKGYIDMNGRPYYYSDEEIAAIDDKRKGYIAKTRIDESDMTKYVCFGYKNFYLGYGNLKNSFSIGAPGAKDFYKPAIQPSDTFRIKNLGQNRVRIDISIKGYNTDNRNETTQLWLQCTMALKYGLVSEAGLESTNPGLRAIILNPVLNENAPAGLETIKGCYIPWENRIYFTGYIQFEGGLKYFELVGDTDTSMPFLTVEKSVLQTIFDLQRLN